MKILCICNTYSHLIVAMQLKLTIKSEDDITLLLSDQAKGTKDIAEKLKKFDLFEEVNFIETKKVCSYGSRLKNVFDVIYGVIGKKPKGMTADMAFDEVIYYNPDLALHSLFTVLMRKNKNTKFNRFEEGVLTYNTIHGIYTERKMRIMYAIKHILGKKNLREVTEKFYCFNPVLYHESLETVEIPKISQDSKIKELLSELFFDGQKYEMPKEKYFYFPSVLDFEGGEPIGELDLAVEIAKNVGIDNLIIKVHPRDNLQRFVDKGLHVDKSSYIPWEAIQLNGDFSEKVFLSPISGSVLSVSPLLENPPKTYFMFNYCKTKNNITAQNSVRMIKGLIENKDFDLKNIEICDDISEIYEH